MKKVLLSLALLSVIVSCKKENQTVVIEDATGTDTVLLNENEINIPESLTLNFSAKSDSNVSGTAQISEDANGVTMVVNVAGLTEGLHAIHIHEFGDCSAADGASAGGHWNPTGHDHGEFGKDAFHLGDIGNLEAGADGNAQMTFTTDKWCLGCEDETKNIMGKSIIIHETVDDFTTQPTGNAGGRIACVVIE
ncbi:MAG: superoxide dismutase family protein [Flavobacteriaceae bacterium]|nr:superoxide dismutase family protein [Flavobacteriaceae bacterium]